MSDWWSYRLEDLLLFSPRAYWRLFELENAALWPLPLIATLLGLLALGLLFRPSAAAYRTVALLLACAWAWVGWSFLWQRYTPINWAAAYVTPLFALQALFLAWLGTVRATMAPPTRKDLPRTLGVVLLGYAVVLHPLTALLAGRSLAGAEVVGIAPDPTAVATLGFALLLPQGAERWRLAIVPSLWLTLSAATLFTLGAWQGWILVTALSLAVTAATAAGRSRDNPIG